ncbi:HU family DNA-binding protein [Bacteroides sp.]
MAILFEWYENPVAPDESAEKRFHARIIYNGRVNTKEIQSRIQARCTVTGTDVTAVLDALSHVMGEELGEGRQVHLDGIGYFYPTLTCTEKIEANTPQRNRKVELKGIKFRADKTLKTAVGHVKLEHSKYARHSQKLSDEEIDKCLEQYFGEHQVLTRRGFQTLCGMTRSTAAGRLRKLREAGKLDNIGMRTQPIYVPMPGCYGRASGINTDDMPQMTETD